MSDKYPYLNYRVYMTVLTSENVYGDTIDVTQDIDLTDWIDSFGSIDREIDNGDYDIGIYTFGNITIKAINYSRKFNSAHDAMSIFPYKRDRTKVEIQFHDKEGNVYSRFKGLVNDDATRDDIVNDSVRFKVLSLDSIFRTVSVPPGAIGDGDLFSEAIQKCVNLPEITSTLTYDPAYINPDLDLQIDVGEDFSNRPVKAALDDLLLASNSVLYIDENERIIVKQRVETDIKYTLAGRGDKYAKNTILSLDRHNNGLHRAISAVEVNGDTPIVSDEWVFEYGFRQKTVNFSFITELEKKQRIAAQILAEFKVPKQELEITVPIEEIKNVNLFDVVQIDYDYKIIPDSRDEFLPMLGSIKLGELRLPFTSGSFRILPKEKWKITGIKESPRNMTATLRLRQAGKETHEGYFGPSLDFSQEENSMYLGAI